jgi:ubiquinone/menaquinone biosynthesis C-methylase UbiE
LGPLDYFSRLVNQKADFPPLHLRRHVGPLRTFESSGAEFMNYLQLLGKLKPHEHVLDIGCGCGLMALSLKVYLNSDGHYTGIEIHQPSIKWCQKNIGTQRSNFQFLHTDILNAAYNPNGKHRGEVYELPFEAQSFDLILFKSVFTHLPPAEVDNYLREVARLLNSKGRCLATFFLLNETQEELDKEGKSALRFNYGQDVWRYVYEHSPESAAAYRESFVMDLLLKHRLVVTGIHYGRWTGRSDGLSFQDIIVIEKGQ